MTVKLFSVAGTEVRLNILSIPIIFLCIALNLADMLLISLIALVFHEIAHLIMAKKLCAHIRYIEIQPCGFTAHINENSISFRDETAIAAAGALFSIISGAITLSFITVTGFESEMLTRFALTSIVIGMVNLLPVLPLDGGRILRSLLNIFLTAKCAYYAAMILGLLLSNAVIFFGIYGIMNGTLNFTVVIIGILMLLGSFTQIKRRDSLQVKSMLRRSSAFTSGEPIGVSTHALSENTSIKSAMSAFNLNKYNVVHEK